MAGERLEHRAGRHRDRRTVTGQFGRPAGGEQPPSGDTVDEVGHDRCGGHIGRGGGDRRLAGLQHRHRGIERGIGHRLPAGVAERREHVAGHRRLDGRHDAPGRHDGLGEPGGGGEPGRGVAHAGGVATRRRRWRGAGCSGDAPEPQRPVQAVETQRHRAQHRASGRADVERRHEPGVAGRARPRRTAEGPIQPRRRHGVHAVPAPDVGRTLVPGHDRGRTGDGPDRGGRHPGWRNGRIGHRGRPYRRARPSPGRAALRLGLVWRRRRARWSRWWPRDAVPAAPHRLRRGRRRRRRGATSTVARSARRSAR